MRHLPNFSTVNRLKYPQGCASCHVSVLNLFYISFSLLSKAPIWGVWVLSQNQLPQQLWHRISIQHPWIDITDEWRAAVVALDWQAIQWSSKTYYLRSSSSFLDMNLPSILSNHHELAGYVCRYELECSSSSSQKLWISI